MKIFVIFAVFAALIFVVSCGSGSKTGDTTDTGETVTDEDTADSEPDDSEPSDTEADDPENPDTTPDNGDSQPDNDADTDSGDTQPDGDTDSGDSQPDDDADTDSGDSQPGSDTSDSGDDSSDTQPDGNADSGDSQPDDTDTDTTPADPCNPNPCTSISNSTGVCTVNGTAYTCGCQSGYTWNGDSCEVPAFPACSSTSSAPCIDSTSGLVWSARASSTYTWANAVSYCDNLTEGDWHLPTIDELRTLLIASRVSANCQVSETNNCLSYSSCFSCSTCTQTGTQSSSGTTDCSMTSYSDGRYSKFGETGGLWSSSVLSDNSIFAWFVSFSYGHVGYAFKANSDGSVRCVRNAD